jgi:hypothetical protein
MRLRDKNMSAPGYRGGGGAHMPIGACCTACAVKGTICFTSLGLLCFLWKITSLAVSPVSTHCLDFSRGAAGDGGGGDAKREACM